MKENYMDHQTTGDDADESIGACPECGAPCTVTWSGLDLVANTGDETLAQKHYEFSPPSTQEEPTTQKLMKHKVKHIPSGETWLSLHMDDAHAYIAGWPPTVVDIKHLEIIEAYGEPDEKDVKHLLNAFGVDLRPKVISSEATQEELWISVKDRLPDSFVPVCIWTNVSIDHPVLGLYSKSTNDWLYCTTSDNFWISEQQHIKVTDWQPLPKPPKNKI